MVSVDKITLICRSNRCEPAVFFWFVVPPVDHLKEFTKTTGDEKKKKTHFLGNLRNTTPTFCNIHVVALPEKL